MSLPVNKIDYSTSTGVNNYISNLYYLFPNIIIEGVVFYIKIKNTNTGASNLNINSFGVKPIKKQFNVDLVAGDLIAESIYAFIYDGTNFQVISDIGNVVAGTVTSVSIASSNGFAGSSSGGATPILTISTSINGILKGNGTSISAVTDSDITGKLLTGYISGAGTVSSTDSILIAIQKLNGNAAALVTGVSSVNSLTGAVALTGTANRLTISAANVFDISSTFEGLFLKKDGSVALTGNWNAGAFSITATTFIGALTGNATTSTTTTNIAGGTNGAIPYQSGVATTSLLAATATASKMLLSGASGAPTWSTSTIPTSAGATANKVLLSDGTNYVLSTPTFPNASATSGKTIRSDGTNWIASTATLSDSPSTSGKILVSDGTNWITSTPTFPNASATTGKWIISDGTNWVASTPTVPNSFAQGDLIYGSASNVLTALAKSTGTSNFLKNSGTSNNPAWAQPANTDLSDYTAPTDWSGSDALVGFSSTTTHVFTYMTFGQLVVCHLYISGTSNSTSFSVTLPFTSINTLGTTRDQVAGDAVDNTTRFQAAIMENLKNTNTLTFYKAAFASWTNSGTKLLSGTYIYYKA